MFRKNNNGLGNSLGYDVRKDDRSYAGYMALARIICGVKDVEGNWKHLHMKKIKQIYRLNEKSAEVTIDIDKNVNKDVVRSSYVNIKLTDIHTGEVKEFETTGQAAAFLGVGTSYITTYIRKNTLIKKKYRMQADRNNNFKINTKYVKTIDVKTGEEKIYNGATTAANEMGISQCYVSYLVRTGKEARGYKFEYLED